MLSLLGDNTLYTVLPDPTIWSRVGLTLTWVGVLLGVNRIVRLIFNTWAGVLYDRLPRRRLLIGSLALGAVCNVIYALAFGPAPFLLGRVLWGLAWSGLSIGGNTVVLDVSTESTRGRNSGHFQMWFFIGVAVGALAGGTFTDLLGFQGWLWVSAAITGLAALFWYFKLPETRPADGSGTSRVPSWHEFPIRESLPAAVPVMAVRFVFAGVMAATTILWLEQYVGRELSLVWIVVPLATLTGAFSAVRVLTSIVGAPLAGRASDRMGRRWPVIAIGLGAGAIGAWLMGGSIIWVALVGALLAAITAGSVQALAPAIIGDRVHEARQSRGLSVVLSLGDIASALGPPLALGLLTTLGISGVYRLSAVVLGVAGVFALLQIRIESKLKPAAANQS
ncbi:MAG: MFS transporter [Chloroflexi bacterium]|nr:MFS transporter [Chloroflexota bacterium]